MVEKSKYSYLIPGIFSFMLLSIGAFSFALSRPEMYIFAPFFGVICIYLIVSYGILLSGKKYIKTNWKPLKEFPTVDVFLPICGESVAIILDAWRHTEKLDWPKDKLNVYVLDDGKGDSMLPLAMSFGFKYIKRKTNEFKKAGNLLNAFRQTNGEFILVLDADFAPKKEFLKETVPFMMFDKKIAIVQTPQYFEVKDNMNWIERGSGYVQELFYRLVQTSRDRHGGSICVGSCAVYRRSSLEAVGGFRQVQHSEDVWTGFTLVNAGGKIKYIPENLSVGRCPDNLKAFFNQQYRWCSGSMSLLFSREFWGSSLTKMQKLCYSSGMAYYISSGLGIFLLNIPSIIIVNFYPENLHWFNLIFYVPSFLFGTVGVWHWSNYKNKDFDFLKLRHVSYYAHLFAMKDKFLGSTMLWVPTGASKNGGSRYGQFLWLCSIWSTFCLSAILFGALKAYGNIETKNLILPIVFALFNFWLSMSSILNRDPLK